MRGSSVPQVGAWEPDLARVPDVVRAPRTDAIYYGHAYLTKVPVGAIRPFVEAFTQPGERVLDMFAGSGMTGLAAASCGRAAVLSDISVLGQHIARGYLTAAPAEVVRREAGRAVAQARERIGDLYQTTRLADGAAIELVRTLWSFVYACPGCSAQLPYFEHLDAAGRPPRTCPQCPEPFVRRSWPRVDDRPVRVVVEGGDGRQVEQAVQRVDLERIARAQHDPRQELVPTRRIESHREMFRRSGLGRAGIRETKQFFSARNALALLELWRGVNAVTDAAVRQKLRFAFTACLARASRRYQWGPKRPLNAQNQTYYVAPVYFEWNVFELFLRKVEAALRADALLFGGDPRLPGSASQVDYQVASAASLRHVAAASVDYVFTDPPFGSNIFYSDMNLFHEAWLGQATDDAQEAVVHTSGPKRHAASERYERTLRDAFREAFRALRPGRCMSVVFGNSSGSVWSLVQRAMRDAGFGEPIHVAILDKGQRSVKGLRSGSEGVVTVDLVLTVRKPASDAVTGEAAVAGEAAVELLHAAAAGLRPEQSKNPSYLYAAVVREAMKRRQRLDHLHYGDLLALLRNDGYRIDAKTGLLDRPVSGSLG